MKNKIIIICIVIALAVAGIAFGLKKKDTTDKLHEATTQTTEMTGEETTGEKPSDKTGTASDEEGSVTDNAAGSSDEEGNVTDKPEIGSDEKESSDAPKGMEVQEVEEITLEEGYGTGGM